MKYNVRCHHCGQLFPTEGQPGQKSEVICPHCGTRLQFTVPDRQEPEGQKPQSSKGLGIFVAILTLLTAAVYIGHSFYDRYLDRQHQQQITRLAQLDSARTVEAAAAERAYAIRKAREDSILRHSEAFIKERVEAIYATAFQVINGTPNDTLDIYRDFFSADLSKQLRNAQQRARRDSLGIMPRNFWAQSRRHGHMQAARVVTVNNISKDSAHAYLRAEQRWNRDDEPSRITSYAGMLHLCLDNGQWLIDDFVNDEIGSYRKLLEK